MQNGLTVVKKNTSIASLCNSCQKKPCCTDFNSPFLFSGDLKNLEKIGKANSTYVKDIVIKGVKAKELQKKPNSNSCIFFDEEKIQCNIYQNRPFDCQMYPFDIMWYENAFHWVVYSCNVDSDWQWCEDHLQKLEADPRFNEMMEKSELLLQTSSGFIPQDIESQQTILRKVIWKPQKKIIANI